MFSNPPASPSVFSHMATPVSIEQQLASIVGIGNLRAATAEDCICNLQPKFVVEPSTEQQLAAALAFANTAGLSVIPRGGATKGDWGNPPKSADLILSTARLNRILEHAWSDLTVIVEAGCTLQSLQQTLAQHGQRLALDALWPDRATIGGALSTNDSGALRLRFGSLRDLIIGVTLALPDGTLAKSGGKVVKNVAGYDLPKLATGALGTLGIITRSVFRVHPLPHAAATLTCVAKQASDAARLFAQLLDSQLAYSGLQTRVQANHNPGFLVDVIFEGTTQGIAAQVAHLQAVASPLSFSEADHFVWQAREQLHSPISPTNTFSALFKMSAAPADAIPAISNLATIATANVNYSAVVQATGLATVILTGDKQQVSSVSQTFRKRMEGAGGSLVALGNSALSSEFDAWGHPGDALPLMRAIKHQLDPNSILNPGRFVGGI
jgi:glycolate oxidase FAD binding subunit